MPKLIEVKEEIEEEEYRAVYMNLSSIHSLAKTKSMGLGFDPAVCGIMDDHVVQVGTRYYIIWSRLKGE